MGFLYLIIAISLLVGFFRVYFSPPAPKTGIADGFFYYKGIPVRKCREVTTDDDGNFQIDGKLFTVRHLDAWYNTLSQ